jgi:small subunit ribosomal protein S1
VRPPSPDQHRDSDHGAHTLRVWEGTITGLYGDDVFVELGPRMQGVVPVRRFARPPRVGDVAEFTLGGREDGLWALHLCSEESLALWEDLDEGCLVSARVSREVSGGLELKVGPLHAFLPRSASGLPRGKPLAPLVGRELVCEVVEVERERQRVVLSRKLVADRERVSDHQRELSALACGRVVEGHVVRVEDYGVFVRFGRGMEGLVHVSNLTHERVRHPADVVAVGDALRARVLRVREGGARIELGCKQLEQDPWAVVAGVLEPGEIVGGRVTRLAEFGAFVRVEPGVEGLVHAGETGLGPGRSLRAHLPPGREVRVRVLAVDAAAERLSLSLLYAGGGTIDPEGDEGPCDAALSGELGSRGARGGIDLKGLLERAFERALEERDEELRGEED